MRLGAAGPSPRVDSERVNDRAGAMKAPGPNMRTRIPPIRFKVCLISGIVLERRVLRLLLCGNTLAAEVRLIVVRPLSHYLLSQSLTQVQKS